MSRPLALTLVALLAVGSLATVARGSGAAGRPPGSPDLAAMALATSDFPSGTRVEAQGYRRDPDFVASYEREFEVGSGRIGRTRLFYAAESLDVETTPQAARRTFELASRFLRSKQGIRAFKEFLAAGGLDPTQIRIGKIRRPAIGHGALVVPIRIQELGVSFRMTLTLMRFDRVLSSVLLMAAPETPVYAADSDRIARSATARIQAGLVPTGVAPPLVTGTLVPGQVVTATAGTWTGDQLTFEYQWERCLVTGTGCVPIAGATGATYAVGTPDLASALRVTVTGRNRLGGASASSAASAPVAGPPGSPVGTAPPRIFGDLVVGSTLTSHPGFWTGEPSAYTYQWRRCDSTGACPDVPGATSPTYVLTAADSGTALRLFVVATNAAGPGGSISPPTAVIP